MKKIIEELINSPRHLSEIKSAEIYSRSVVPHECDERIAVRSVDDRHILVPFVDPLKGYCTDCNYTYDIQAPILKSLAHHKQPYPVLFDGSYGSHSRTLYAVVNKFSKQVSWAFFSLHTDEWEIFHPQGLSPAHSQLVESFVRSQKIIYEVTLEDYFRGYNEEYDYRCSFSRSTREEYISLCREIIRGNWNTPEERFYFYYIPGVDFSGIDLSGTRFTGATLDGGDFRNVLSPPQSFSYTSVRRSDFRGVDLKGVCFHSANLSGADFRGADLRGAELRPSGSFSESVIEGANFDGALIDKDTKIEGTGSYVGTPTFTR